MNDNLNGKSEEVSHDDGEKKKTNAEKMPESGKKFSQLFYIAIGCFAVGVILFILAIVFTLTIKNGIGIYFLISSMIAELACVSFLNGHKQKYGQTKLLFIFKILSYVVMGAGLAVFIIGTGINVAN